MTADDGLEDYFSDYEARARRRRERRLPPRGPGRRVPRWAERSLAETRHLARTPGGRIMVGAVAALALLTLIGLAALWPRGFDGGEPTGALGGPTVGAEVAAARLVECPGPTPQRCRQLRIAVEGRTVPLTLGPSA